MKDEMLACFDAQGNAVEPHLRSEALSQPFPDYYHAVSNIWVIDNNLKMLCSQRSGHVANPLRWQSKFGGHVQAGMSFVENAVKELAEEAGLHVEGGDLIFVERNVNEGHKHFSENFLLIFDPYKHVVHFDDGEVIASQWLSFEEYNADRQENPGKWTNNIEVETQKKILEIIQSL